MMRDTEELKRQLKLKVKKKRLDPSELLSTGSTLLNLALTGNPAGGFMKGKYHFAVGDSKSGKTFLGLTCLAEACQNSNFNNYRLIHDDVEDGALMSMEKFFGKKVAKRLEPPARDDDGSSVFSSSIEDFYFHLDDAFKHDTPFIYVLDSMDGLTSEFEEDKFDKKKKASREGKESTGTMTDNKAKINSTWMRLAQKKLRQTNSILVVVNQTRDNLGFGFSEKTRSGGRALTFYATSEMWSAVVATLTKTVRGTKREIGIRTEVKVKKNRGTGKLRTVQFPIFHSYGIDDIGSCIDYLITEKHWKKSDKRIVAKGLRKTATKEELIKHIEKYQLEDKLKEIVAQVWHEIEASLEVDRKKRFA